MWTISDGLGCASRGTPFGEEDRGERRVDADPIEAEVGPWHAVDGATHHKHPYSIRKTVSARAAATCPLLYRSGGSLSSPAVRLEGIAETPYNAVTDCLPSPFVAERAAVPTEFRCWNGLRHCSEATWAIRDAPPRSPDWIPRKAWMNWLVRHLASDNC